MDDEYDHRKSHQESLPQFLVNVEKRTEPNIHVRGKIPTIPIVDDEVLILELMCDILKRAGYIVLSASSPSRAIEIAQEHEGIIDLLITDIVMPEMNGQKLASKISHISPATKILLMSGYTADIISPRPQNMWVDL